MMTVLEKNTTMTARTGFRTETDRQKSREQLRSIQPGKDVVRTDYHEKHRRKEELHEDRSPLGKK
jgi:hypothetical protein